MCTLGTQILFSHIVAYVLGSEIIIGKQVEIVDVHS